MLFLEAATKSQQLNLAGVFSELELNSVQSSISTWNHDENPASNDAGEDKKSLSSCWPPLWGLKESASFVVVYFRVKEAVVVDDDDELEAEAEETTCSA